MNNKIISTVLVISIYLLILPSCEKDNAINEVVSDNHFSNLFDMKIDEENNISISTISIEGNTTTVQVMGQFTEDRSELKPVTSFKINDIEIPFVHDRYMGSYPDNRLGNAPILEQVAGKNININVDCDFGSNINEFKIYNPNPIVFSIKEDDRNISRKNGLRLKWNPDNSLLREDDLVGVNVVYRGINGGEFEQLDNIGLSKSVQDNGELFISEEELSIFPVNSKIDINMVRGNYGIVEHSDDIETLVIAYSLDSHRIIIID